MSRASSRALHGPFLNQGPPLERAGVSFLILLAVAILLFHAALVFLFYPVVPDPPERIRKRTTILLSEGDPGYDDVLRLLRQYAPDALIHPPEGVGYSALQGRMQFTPVYEPAAVETPDLVPHELVEIPMVDFIPASAPLIVPKNLSDETTAPRPDVSYPVCFLNGLLFDASDFHLSERDAQDLQKNPPPRATLLTPFRAGKEFPWESQVLASCGNDRLDFLARGFWDRKLNSHDCPPDARDENALLKVVWSAALPEMQNGFPQEKRP